MPSLPDVPEALTAPQPLPRTAPGGALPEHPHVPARILAPLLIGIGALFRILQYAGNRSLWLDEALLLNSFLHRSAAEILSPAGFGPVPQGFLLLEKLATLALGTGELALRLVPLLAGLAALPLFWRVAGRAASPRGRVLAMALFALSPFLVYYASEVKPYATDVLVALLVLHAAFGLLEGRLTGRRAVALAVAGPVCVFFSQTAAFVVAGAAAALVGVFLRRRDAANARALLAVVGAWLLLAAVPLALLLRRPAEAGGYVQLFWRSGFMPLPPRSLHELAWFPDNLLKLFRDPLGVLDDAQVDHGFYGAAAGMAAFAAGAAWLWATARERLLVLLAPVAATLLASALHLYPFGGDWISAGRVILFLAPGLFLVMGEGGARLLDGVQRPLRPVALAVVALLLAPPLAHDVLAIPYGRAEIKPVLAYVAAHREPGDVLWVNYDARFPFQYYAGRYGYGAGGAVLGRCARFEPQEYARQLSALAGRPRVWVLFGDGRGAHRFDEKAFMLGYLDQVGRRLDDRVSVGFSAYLYDLRPLPGRGAVRLQVPALAPDPVEGCALWG